MFADNYGDDKLIITEDGRLESVEYKLGDVVHHCGVDIDVRHLQNVLRGLGLELSFAVEMLPRTSKVRATF